MQLDLYRLTNLKPAAMARILGVSRQAAHKWFRVGVIPIHRAVQLELATGGAIKRSELRPDIFLETQ